MKYKTLVVGLGNIGMGYDFDKNPQFFISTHCQAVNVHPNFELMGGVDPNLLTRKNFQSKFSKPVFSDIQDVSKDLNPDIITISTPTNKHYENIKHAIEFSPKLVLIEKPLAYNKLEIEKIINLCNSYPHINIGVNYIREFEPLYYKFAKKIKNGFLGFPLKIIIKYSKGVINNGSHFIQYISNFMGSLTELKVINNGRKWEGVDPEPDIFANYENGEVYLLAFREEDYSSCTIEILGKNGKITIDSKGDKIYHYEVIQDEKFSNYNILNEDSKVYKSDITKYQYYVYDNIFESLKNKSSLKCNLNSIRRTLEFYNILENRLK